MGFRVKGAEEPKTGRAAPIPATLILTLTLTLALSLAL